MDETVLGEFKRTASVLAGLYRKSVQERDRAFNAGREDAATEVLELLNCMKQQEMKYVNIDVYLGVMRKYFPQLSVQQFPDTRKRSRNN